jgi:Mg-chelatase subunit ChlD
MTAPGPNRFRFLASAVAGRPLDVADAEPGDPPWTDGRAVYVTVDGSSDQQRRELLVQAVLLGGGSLDAELARRLRGRPRVARRYLTLEARRLLPALNGLLPGVSLGPGGAPMTGGAEESLTVALGRRAIEEPPEWFGALRPARLLPPAEPAEAGTPTDQDLQAALRTAGLPDIDDDEDHEDAGRLLKLLQNPLARSGAMMEALGRMLGMGRKAGEGTGGAELPAGSARAARQPSPRGRPVAGLAVPMPESGWPAGTGWRYPEWDEHRQRYRPEWCTVLDFAPVPGDARWRRLPERDDVVRRRLARLGLGLRLTSHQPDGEDLDMDAVVQFQVDLMTGSPPHEDIYRQSRRLRRDLSVLVLVDVSGSAVEQDREGAAVHDHQLDAAATLVGELEALGDRVACYGFRSRGRSAVHLLRIKAFDHRFDAAARDRLARLEPVGFTRLGAAIRHGTEVLRRDGGTPRRLLVLLSDGFPYDDGYEGGYGEADAHRSVAEARQDGIGALCVSLGGATGTDALRRVFGAAACVGTDTLAGLRHRIDALFLQAIGDAEGARRDDLRARLGQQATR